MVRNMRTIGLDPPRGSRRGSSPSTPETHLLGLESHPVAIHKLVNATRPRVVVIDRQQLHSTAPAPRSTRCPEARRLQVRADHRLLHGAHPGAACWKTEVEIRPSSTWLLVGTSTVGSATEGCTSSSHGMAPPTNPRVRDDRQRRRPARCHAGLEGVLTGSMREARRPASERRPGAPAGDAAQASRAAAPARSSRRRSPPCAASSGSGRGVETARR
jgi:hypothetical protein